MKDLKYYLPLYLEQKIFICLNLENNPVIDILTPNLLSEWLGEFDDYDYKLLLRPLSSMTEDQKVEMDRLQRFNINKDWSMLEGFARAINWARENGFDCDQLIESGLAIDLTTIKV